MFTLIIYLYNRAESKVLKSFHVWTSLYFISIVQNGVESMSRIKGENSFFNECLIQYVFVNDILSHYLF